MKMEADNEVQTMKDFLEKFKVTKMNDDGVK